MKVHSSDYDLLRGLETVRICEEPVKSSKNFRSNLAPEVHSSRETVNPTVP